MNPKEIQKLYTGMKPQNPSVDFRGGQLSIQASEYNYCHPKHDHGPYTCFEVAYLVNDSFEKIPELKYLGIVSLMFVELIILSKFKPIF